MEKKTMAKIVERAINFIQYNTLDSSERLSLCHIDELKTLLNEKTMQDMFLEESRISHVEYENAKKTINQYKKQTQNDLVEVDKQIEKFDTEEIDCFHHLSIRTIHNIIKYYEQYFGQILFIADFEKLPYSFLQKIEIKNMKKINGAGGKTLCEIENAIECFERNK